MDYTKGEWIADDGDSELWGVFQEEDGDGIAYLCEPNGKLLRPVQAQANAQLIAAAPLGAELAEFVIRISATIIDENLLEIGEGDYIRMKELALKFRAKAEGK